MKLHKNLCEAVIGTLSDIFNQGKYADKALENTLKSNPKWGSRDRSFIAESTYEIVRWWRKLIAWAHLPYQEGKIYSVPELWHILGTWLMYSFRQPLPDWKEFENVQSTKEAPTPINHRPELIESIPDWLLGLLKEELPETWLKEIQALNQPAPLVIRANTLKTSTQDLKKALTQQNIPTDPVLWAPEALVIRQRQNIFKNNLFKEGWFELQDAGSQAIGSFLEVEPSMRVIDACAGGGGKTLHMGSLMQNKGRIIAMDVESYKLLELKKRARRAGLTIIETRPIDSLKAIKRLKESADRLLLDVPCSGLGVLRRNPDAKWKLSLEFINQVRNTQASILETYPTMLRKGGKMVYATCSILPSENQKQVETFLEKNKNFKLLDQKNISPSEHGFDGFYMALLQKN